ncbi:MAG: hypothetical protein DMD97_04980 [Candidatus Rokuibacteriota bacterium]|nr:MAG: hypothetical protein DMD97_04980 [Candidatus Rokubacteria bacterium]
MKADGHSLLIVVPKTEPDACRSLSQTFADDASVKIIVDRRRADRRVQSNANGHGPERRQNERRRRIGADAELKVDRWIAVPRASGHVDFRDLDVKALLFLCCNNHVVPCQKCQDTYRLGWISHVEPGALPCPRCGTDLMEVVVAHAQTCRYWADHRSAQQPLTHAS